MKTLIICICLALSSPLMASPCQKALGEFSNFEFSNTDYDSLKNALLETHREDLKQFDNLLKSNETPTFENLILPYISSSNKRRDALYTLATLNSTMKSEDTGKLMQSYSKQASRMSKRELDIDFFKKVEHVFKNMNSLSPIQQSIVKDIYDGFIEGGIKLNKKDKEKLFKLKLRLSELSRQFDKNLAIENRNFTFTITDIRELKGLSPAFIESIKKVSPKLGAISYELQSSGAHASEVMRNSENEALRKKYYNFFASEGAVGSNNNRSITLEIMKIKQEITKLLGNNTFAESSLKHKMAGTPDTVYKFLLNQISKHKETAKQEHEKIQRFKEEATGDLSAIKPWSLAYWSNKYKTATLNFNPQELKAYFALKETTEGMFKIANKLYGISFQKVDHLSTYHEDVATYEVQDEDGHVIAYMFADFFARPGTKNGGAWMQQIRPHEYRNGKRLPAVVTINTNFNKGDSQLSLSQAETLFHEFGHALHGILSTTEFKIHAGTSVMRDFVELPSQFMENYIWERESLDLFAKHSENGEKIPEKLFQQMLTSRNFGKSSRVVGSAALSLLDMAWHDTEVLPDNADIKTLREFEVKAMQPAKINYDKPLESHPKKFRTASFDHIISGYSAGFYGYAWADVLAEDVFEAFKETGDIFNPEVAARFRKLLAAGGSVDPLELYTEFRGEEPSFIGDKN